MDNDNNNNNFVRVVSFDTMTNKDLPDYSYTLRAKSPGYKRSRRSRTFMVATDLANYSEYALNWAKDVGYLLDVMHCNSNHHSFHLGCFRRWR